MILTMVKNELKKQLKDKSFFFWLLGMPILFIAIFAVIFGSFESVTFNVHYVDSDRSQMSEELLTILNQSETFEIIEESSLEGAVSALEGGNISSFLHIPAGFEERLLKGEQNLVDFYIDALREDSVRPVNNLIENVAFSFQQQKIEQAITGYVPQEEAAAILEAPFALNVIEQQSNEQNAITQIVPGYTVMFTFFIIISMVSSFLTDRDHGMVARIASSPLNKYQYLLGKWLPFMIIVFIQIWALLGFGYFVYDLYLGNLFAIFILSIFLTLTTTGLGLAIALFSKTENFGIMITQILALGGAMLGGLWVPIEILPSFMQTIALFIPQYWAQQAFQEIMLRDGTILDITSSLAVLSGVALIGLIFAGRYFNTFLRGAKS